MVDVSPEGRTAPAFAMPSSMITDKDLQRNARQIYTLVHAVRGPGHQARRRQRRGFHMLRTGTGGEAFALSSGDHYCGHDLGPFRNVGG